MIFFTFLKQTKEETRMNIEITANNADFLKQAIYRLVDTERAKLSRNYYSRSLNTPITITPSQKILDHIDLEVSYSPILEQATVKASGAKYSALFNDTFKLRLKSIIVAFSVQNPKRSYLDGLHNCLDFVYKPSTLATIKGITTEEMLKSFGNNVTAEVAYELRLCDRFGKQLEDQYIREGHLTQIIGILRENGFRLVDKDCPDKRKTFTIMPKEEGAHVVLTYRDIVDPDATRVTIQTENKRTWFPDSKRKIIALPGHPAIPYRYHNEYAIQEWFDEQINTIYPTACELRDELINAINNIGPIPLSELTRLYTMRSKTNID